ncbi:hypothetical protein [Conexibacter woesei]|uniref:hypothetical protein n=1 Tax=Conexibacter woesei TaxID=191495 RepID=UPI0012DC752E|nr:hypothetical protein [Conexibacter woesei]
MTADSEAPRELVVGQSDAVTVAFADEHADVCGVARIGRALDESGAVVTSGLAVLFAGGSPVAVRAEGGVPAGEGLGWGRAEAAGVWTEVVDPLRAWRIHFDSEDGEHSFLLDLEAVSTPAVLDGDAATAKLGGMEGYDQLIKVTGRVTVGGVQRTFSGRGQRGHSWGAPDWDKLTLARTMGVWLDGDAGVTLTAVRGTKASSHADESIHAVLLGRDGETGEPVSLVVADPRVSTTYDAEGRQRHAGLELYETDESPYARRAAGEVACGTTLDLGRLRLDTAFFTWRMEGRSGVGRYDVLRRVEA